MSRRQKPRVELNFDGLTDSIMNLAGSLILLVVLVFAITKAKESGEEQPPPPDNKAGGELSISPLMESLQSVNSGLTGVEREVQRIEARLPELAADIEELQQKSKPGP
jgi:hypothetical protein